MMIKNKEIIIGSSALKFHGFFVDGYRYSNMDLDSIVCGDSVVYDGVCDDVLNIPAHIFDMVDHVCGHATPDAILTIKMSHLQWDIKWDKTLCDIIMLMESGYTFKLELYHALVDYWKSYHGDKKKHLSLDKNKNDFFNDAVDYIYDHDLLHEYVAYPNQPMYKRCLKDGEDVLIDRDKFFAMPLDHQVKMFQEEVMTIAIERLIIPKIVKGLRPMSLSSAYKWSLQRTITNLTKNWASDFIIFNIVKMINPDFNQMKQAVEMVIKEKVGDQKGFVDVGYLDIDKYLSFDNMVVVSTKQMGIYRNRILSDPNGVTYSVDDTILGVPIPFWASSRRVEKVVREVVTYG